MASIPSVTEFYAGRGIFITGATGFLGKVLLEKLLRSCPEIKAVYLLIRPKRGKSTQERLEEILESSLFERLRTQEPEFHRKCFAIEGDIVKDGLGIEHSQVELLVQEVSVVFHSAATVKFDEEMKLSAEMNVVGVQRMLDLGRKLPNLVSFVHISTAYANCNVMEIKEEIYPPPLQPTQFLSAVGWMDAEAFDILTPRMLGSRPNTYTYTKSIAETLVKENAGNLPVAIFRPSIVAATLKEPVSGWVDNLTGATGLIAAASMGLLRIMKADHNAIADIVPVDITANMMVAIGWYTASHTPSTMKVYNCTTGQIQQLTWGMFRSLAYEQVIKNPVDKVVRLPDTKLTTNEFWYDMNIVFNQLLPAHIMDFFMWMFGKKRMFVRLDDKIRKAAGTVSFFATRSWKFSNENLFMLEKALSVEDRETFNFNPKRIHWPTYIEQYCLGIKRYVLKEELSKLPQARKTILRLQRLHLMFNVLICIGIWRLCLKRVKVVRMLWDMLRRWVVTIFQKIPMFAKSS